MNKEDESKQNSSTTPNTLLEKVNPSPAPSPSPSELPATATTLPKKLVDTPQERKMGTFTEAEKVAKKEKP